MTKRETAEQNQNIQLVCQNIFIFRWMLHSGKIC